MGTAEMLETLGHQVEQAASGSGALRTLRSGAEFDLLIADYMMPGMTGTALIEQARRQRPGLAALLITGYAGSGSDPDDGLPRLGKPFGQAQLEAAIAGVLESSQARASIL